MKPSLFLMTLSIAASFFGAAGRLPAAEANCLGRLCTSNFVEDDFEYVIIGAGAGGGPLAARLARYGHKVLLLEAGEAPELETEQDKQAERDARLQKIPALHALASENPSQSWSFFVDHYDDPNRARLDNKFVEGKDASTTGIFYPRGTGLGGSTNVNAMITVYPHTSDWEDMAELLGNESWRPAAMRQFFTRIEDNQYLLGPPFLHRGHGFDGWLPTDLFPRKLYDLGLAAQDPKYQSVLLGTIRASGVGIRSDINSVASSRDQQTGTFRLPQNSKDGTRTGVKDLLLQTVAEGYPLTIKWRAFVSKIDFSEGLGPVRQAVGVSWQEGKHLYKAARLHNPEQFAVTKSLKVSREVIISAGAFNTPQILKLSGIGPKAELESHGIPVLVDLPGVGENLQDRYEIGVTGEIQSNWGGDARFSFLRDCTFSTHEDKIIASQTDPCYRQWLDGVGPYTSNGAAFATIMQSQLAQQSNENPDMIIFGLPGYFRGYLPGYSKRTTATGREFSWVVLKAHTENRDGSVRLRSADPSDRPQISFRFFEDNGGINNDLKAMVEGVHRVRKIISLTNSALPAGYSMQETYPGAQIQSDADIAQYIQNESWGHHVCCSAKIGSEDDPMAVLDGDFRVRGTKGLRVVDASVFPKIPGFFLVAPIYMISEKAADVIHESTVDGT